MQQTYPYDAFLSHAVEDKIPIANELYERLKAKGLNIWYSGRELNVGDPVIESIHEGLDQCRFGIVIISPTYITKIWALREFFALLEKEKTGKKVILPVFYDITADQLAARAPEMVNIFGLKADKGLDLVVDQLYHEIIKEKTKISPPKARFRKFGWAALFSVLMLLAAFLSYKQFYGAQPGHELISHAIQDRIETLQKKADLDLQQMIQADSMKTITGDEVKKLFTEFNTVKSNYRNEFSLHTGLQTIHAKKNVEAILLMDMDLATPFNLYDLLAPLVYKNISSPTRRCRNERYLVYNSQPVSYHQLTTSHVDQNYLVTVTYTNPIRLIHTTLLFPCSPANMKKNQVNITALRPRETFSFAMKNDHWVLQQVE